MINENGVDRLLDDLMEKSEMQKRWALNPEEVAEEYRLTATQKTAMIDGDVDALIAEGLAERHVQEMRVSW